MRNRLLLAWVMSILCIGIGAFQTEAATLPVQSVLQQQEVVKIQGDWLFFENELYDGLEPPEIYERGKRVTIPQEFEAITGNVNGYGTYVTQVEIPASYKGQVLAIRSPYQYSAMALYVNGERIATSGQVGRTEAEHVTMLESQTGYFKVEESVITIAIQISSFAHIRGGLANPLFIGEASLVDRQFQQQVYFIIVLLGIILAVGILTLIIGLLRREEKAFLAFALFCFSIVVRTLMTVPFIYRLLPIDISYVTATKLEYIATCLTAMFYVWFIYYLYRDLFKRSVVVFNSVILATIVLITLFTQPLFFQQVFFILGVSQFIVVMYIAVVFRNALKHRRRFIIPNCIGVAITLGGMITDYFSGVGIINVFPMTLFCLTINVIIVVMSIANRYAQQFTETAQLNEELVQMNNTLDETIRQRTAELSKANERLHKQAMYDSLTGIYNRQYLNDTLPFIFNEAKTKQEPFSIMMFDLDEFKKYNDFYGHLEGDAILQTVTQIVAAQLPDDIIFVRYGGEEFILLMPNYTKEQAYAIAEHLRGIVHDTQLVHEGRMQGYVTISGGVATLADKYETPRALIEAADQALYTAKRSGRNKVYMTT